MIIQHFTWFLLSKRKTLVLFSFIHCKNVMLYMENLLVNDVKILCENCGGEYTNTDFQNSCSFTNIYTHLTPTSKMEWLKETSTYCGRCTYTLISQ